MGKIDLALPVFHPSLRDAGTQWARVWSPGPQARRIVILRILAVALTPSISCFYIAAYYRAALQPVISLL